MRKRKREIVYALYEVPIQGEGPDVPFDDQVVCEDEYPLRLMRVAKRMNHAAQRHNINKYVIRPNPHNVVKTYLEEFVNSD